MTFMMILIGMCCVVALGFMLYFIQDSAFRYYAQWMYGICAKCDGTGGKYAQLLSMSGLVWIKCETCKGKGKV